MKRLSLLIVLFWGILSATHAGNVRITQAPWVDVDNMALAGKRTPVTMTVEWNNSWRDNHNWDAVYIFLKSKRITDVAWSHVYLRDHFHVLSDGYDYMMASDPGGKTDRSIGIFIFRKAPGAGSAKVDLQLQWAYGNQGLSYNDFVNGLQYEAFAIEMVYVPKGPFRLGDVGARNAFQKKERQILPAWDVLSTSFLMSSQWRNSDPTKFVPTDLDRGPDRLCDRDNSPNSSYWVSPQVKEGLTLPILMIDFKTPKTIKYAALELLTNDVTSWEISGGTKSSRGYTWDRVFSFTNSQRSINSQQTYPAIAAYPLLYNGAINTKAYQYYKVTFNMASERAHAIVRTLSMTEEDLSGKSEDSYVIDGNATTIAFGSAWNNLSVAGKNLSGSLAYNQGSRIVHYPVGYEGFFAMKYEISQRQYVDFLNKLVADEQRSRTVGSRLDELSIGDYVYGATPKLATCRNGIVMGAMQDNRYAFACDLNRSNVYNQSDDGGDIACNFLSPRDMLAYAAWSGLRPLSELEYEKMGRRTIDSLSAKIPPYSVGGYAWGSTTANLPSGSTVSGSGTSKEKITGANVNTGDKQLGPVRCGSFLATSSYSAQSSGGSYYGLMELSGNLAEIYYRAEPIPMLLSQELASHGSGFLETGEVPSGLYSYWGNPGTNEFANSMILRGGHFRSDERLARLGEREAGNSYSAAGINRKDSTVTFRLGYSVTAYRTSDTEYYPFTWIQNENGVTANSGERVYDTVCSSLLNYSYTITGSDPKEVIQPTGELRYAWYFMPENTGIWTLMEGKNSKNLTLTKSDLDHQSATYRTYSYKRRIYTPTQYSESGVVTLQVGYNRPFTHDAKEVLQASNQVSGVLVESMPVADFSWYWSPNSSGTNRKPLPAFYTTNNSSYMSIHRDSFPSSVTNGRLICRVTTRELKCVAEVSVPLEVKPRPTTGTASNAGSFPCGTPMQDKRDNKFYTTVKVGTQCWMAENLRYTDKENRNTANGYSVSYDARDPQGTVLGVYYYSHSTYLRGNGGICPAGWRIPTVDDFNTLTNIANNYGEDEYGIYRLRAGNFWYVSNHSVSNYNHYLYAKTWNDTSHPAKSTGEQGFNTLGFGFTGGTGYYHDYNHAALMTDTHYSNPWVYVWRSYTTWGYSDFWAAGGYYFPVRCIK